ncbi:MAG: endonuclease/exonuclease/phosphatase family protein [Anaerolineales bacterium]|nr:endonuclease/exonuclease/phosphatase family protein [Anaerolineales bacterium]
MKKTVSKFSILVTGYVILIMAWFVSWLVVGDANWWLVLVNRLVPYLFIPVPILLFWSIRSRKYRDIVLLLIPALIFVWLYRPYVFPKNLQSGSSDGQLRVMTYNVLFSNFDYDAVANIVLVYEPDLVALQEVKPEMMDALKDRLAGKYPYSVFGTENDYGTTTVFSKSPLDVSYILDLQADRPAVVVKTKVHGRNVTFASLHLLAYNLWWTKLKDIPEVVMQRTANQNRQAKILLNDLEKDDGIVIVGCDCNSYETSGSYRILEQSMESAARKVGWLLNKNELPNAKQDVVLQHIDHIWFRGEVEPVRMYKIKDDGGSDHLPVLAIFDFR